MKKLLAAILAVMMCVIPLAGCGSEGNTTTPATTENVSMSEAGVFPIVSEKVSMEIVMPDETYIGDLNTNDFAKWYEEKTGVQVNYVEVPSTEAMQKVNLMLASNDLPDMFMSTLNEIDVNLNGSRGMFIPLNDLIDKYGVETKKVFAENSNDLPGMITAVDGNIYALPNINACFHCMHCLRAWINTTWLENMGLDYPETTDDFAEVLRAFKNGDPRGNGKNDGIPMSGANEDGYMTQVYPFLLNSFVPFYFDSFSRNPYVYMDGNEIKFAADSEDFRDGLRWIRSLVDEGLIDPMAFTQTDEQLLQLGSDPSGPMVGVVPAFVWWQVTPGDDVSPDKRSHQYTALSPLKGPKGYRNAPLTGRAVAVNKVAITKASKIPEVAFRWLDGLYSDEVTMRSQFGVEDKGWQQAPAGSVGINRKPALYVPIWFADDDASSKMNTRMDNIMMANRTADFRLGEMTDWDDPEALWKQEPRLFRETADRYVPYANDGQAVPPLSYTEEEGDRLSMIFPQINTYIKESIVLFATGNKDLDKDWDAYKAELETLGQGDYVKIRQTAYDRQYKK